MKGVLFTRSRGHHTSVNSPLIDSRIARLRKETLTRSGRGTYVPLFRVRGLHPSCCFTRGISPESSEPNIQASSERAWARRWVRTPRTGLTVRTGASQRRRVNRSHSSAVSARHTASDRDQVYMDRFQALDDSHLIKYFTLATNAQSTQLCRHQANSPRRAPSRRHKPLPNRYDSHTYMNSSPSRACLRRGNLPRHQPDLKADLRGSRQCFRRRLRRVRAPAR